MLVRHDVDRLGRASSASNESASLELLQTLMYALVGATILRRTNECSRTGRARCAMLLPIGQWHAHVSRPCHSCGVGLTSRRTGPASLHSHAGT